jgi:hypothetical protein
VAGTAVVAELVLAGVPQWRAVAAALALIALLLWLWYLALVARGLRAIIVDRARGGVNGAILLSTVSTQSIVILGPLLEPRQVPRAAWAVLVILGYLGLSVLRHRPAVDRAALPAQAGLAAG